MSVVRVEALGLRVAMRGVAELQEEVEGERTAEAVMLGLLEASLVGEEDRVGLGLAPALWEREVLPVAEAQALSLPLPALLLLAAGEAELLLLPAAPPSHPALRLPEREKEGVPLTRGLPVPTATLRVPLPLTLPPLPLCTALAVP